jgi:methionine aminopeptidase
VLSHKIKRHIIDGNDVIINRATPTQQVKEYQFAPGDVIGLDVFVSTGEGKPREDEARCTVFKRELEQVYNLKSKSAREFFVEVNKRFPTLPFSMRAMNNQVAAKVGVRECINHDMLIPYMVLSERPGEFVAQFKATIVVQANSTAVIAGGAPLDTSKLISEHSVQDAGLQGLLAQDLWKKAKKKAA